MLQTVLKYLPVVKKDMALAIAMSDWRNNFEYNNGWN